MGWNTSSGCPDVADYYKQRSPLHLDENKRPDIGDLGVAPVNLNKSKRLEAVDFGVNSLVSWNQNKRFGNWLGSSMSECPDVVADYKQRSLPQLDTSTDWLLASLEKCANSEVVDLQLVLASFRMNVQADYEQRNPERHVKMKFQENQVHMKPNKWMILVALLMANLVNMTVRRCSSKTTDDHHNCLLKMTTPIALHVLKKNSGRKLKNIEEKRL